MTALRGIAGVAALLCACQQAPIQTHVVLEVSVADKLAKRVTSVELHGQKPGGSRDEGMSRGSDYKAGGSVRFVLRPSAGQSQLQVRVVALQGRQEVAAAVVRSRYQVGRGLNLRVSLGCEGERNLGEQIGSESVRGVIDSCGYEAKDKAVAAGAGGAAGGGGRGMIVDAVMGDAGMGGAAGGGGGGGAGAGDSGSGSGSGSGGMGGAGAGGAGAGGSGGGAAGSRSGELGCYSWRAVAKIEEVETLMPEAFSAGIEQRENPSEEVKQFICLATPPGMTTKLIGKASRWGCYMPGSGTTAYTVTTDVEILISRNSDACLRWSPLDPMRDSTSALMFGNPERTRVCRVFHEEIGEDRNTSGPRVGQVRKENGQWVCRYEFYSYLGKPTLTNQPGEVCEVLE